MMLLKTTLRPAISLHWRTVIGSGGGVVVGRTPIYKPVWVIGTERAIRVSGGEIGVRNRSHRSS